VKNLRGKNSTLKTEETWYRGHMPYKCQDFDRTSSVPPETNHSTSPLCRSSSVSGTGFLISAYMEEQKGTSTV